MKKVLVVSEAPLLPTGYAVMSREILPRLAATGRFDITLLACAGVHNDPSLLDLPYKVVSNEPNPADPDEVAAYRSHPINEQGLFRFDELCLSLRPDAVVSFRDFTADFFLDASPLRPYYSLALCATVDAEPQPDEAAALYGRCDAALTYTKWGAGVLGRQGVRVAAQAPPVADYGVFTPVADKASLRASLGMPPDALVVGSVLRNQPRKRFPELIEAFRLLREAAPESSRGRLRLYLHTGQPDAAWDLPRLLRDAGLLSATYFTYVCKACGSWGPSLWAGVRSPCRSCGAAAAGPVSVVRGLPDRELAVVYNLFDVHAQVASCFVPGTPILSERGWVAIESVAAGDKVWSHAGRWQKVLQTFKKDYSADAIQLSCWSTLDKVVTTREHPVLALTYDNVKHLYSGRNTKEVCLRMVDLGKSLPDPVFVEAGDLKAGDFIAYRIDDTVEDIEKIDFANYVNKYDKTYRKAVCITWGDVVPRYVDVNSEFCVFLGLFAADGSSSGSRLSVTCHAKETRNQKLAARVLRRVGGREPKVEPYKDRKAVNVSLYSKRHVEMMRTLCGVGSAKRLPDWATRLPEKKVKRVLQGIFLGDGCYAKSRNTSILSITSLPLALQVEYILRRLRLRYNFSSRDRGGRRKRMYRFEVGGNVAALNFKCVRKSTSFYYGPWHLLQIRSTERKSYDGPVHNIEVEKDNSYTTRLGCVHNCEGLGVPQLEAAGCGVPGVAVDYSAMGEVMREIGGAAVPPAAFTTEAHSHRRLAVPDPPALAATFRRLLTLPGPVRAALGYKQREAAAASYTWDRTAAAWAGVLDALPPPAAKWTDPPRRFRVPAPPPHLSDLEFSDFVVRAATSRSDLHQAALRMARDLGSGVTKGWLGGIIGTPADVGAHQVAPYDRETALAEARSTAALYARWDVRRAGRP